MTLRDPYFLTSSVSTSRIKLAKYWFTLSHPSSWVSMNSVLPRSKCSSARKTSVLKLQLLLATNGDNRPSPEFFYKWSLSGGKADIYQWNRNYSRLPPLALRNVIHPYGIRTYSLCFAIPVTSCECERRAIKLQPLNIYMGAPSYALLLLHYCNTVDLDVVKIPMCTTSKNPINSTVNNKRYWE